MHPGLPARNTTHSVAGGGTSLPPPPGLPPSVNFRRASRTGKLSSVKTTGGRANEIFRRIVDGYTETDGTLHRLRQVHGFNRYWGDDYYRSDSGAWDGISAEWPMFLFWASIICSTRGEWKAAYEWFLHGCEQITENGMIPRNLPKQETQRPHTACLGARTGAHCIRNAPARAATSAFAQRVANPPPSRWRIVLHAHRSASG